MSSASMTFGRPTRSALPSVSGLFVAATASVVGMLHRFDQWLLDPSRGEPKTAAEVLQWARRIESTDPGLASDLRAAALRSMD
jgi:hypothetical protein